MKWFNNFKKWTIDRYLRLVIAVVVAVLSITSQHYGLLFFAALFLFLAIGNVSCTGYGGCANSDSQDNADIKSEEETTVDYEEIQ